MGVGGGGGGDQSIYRRKTEKHAFSKNFCTRLYNNKYNMEKESQHRIVLQFGQNRSKDT